MRAGRTERVLAGISVAHGEGGCLRRQRIWCVYLVQRRTHCREGCCLTHARLRKQFDEDQGLLHPVLSAVKGGLAFFQQLYDIEDRTWLDFKSPDQRRTLAPRRRGGAPTIGGLRTWYSTGSLSDSTTQASTGARRSALLTQPVVEPFEGQLSGRRSPTDRQLGRSKRDFAGALTIGRREQLVVHRQSPVGRTTGGRVVHDRGQCRAARPGRVGLSLRCGLQLVGGVAPNGLLASPLPPESAHATAARRLGRKRTWRRSGATVNTLRERLQSR